ncbi:hypothetical protein LX36DRAFT_428168 [Colletotrichum falcatum]|nr:hypothetical protein LX36DRAFT_428168 [Colletotrichum falcatum]
MRASRSSAKATFQRSEEKKKSIISLSSPHIPAVRRRFWGTRAPHVLLKLLLCFGFSSGQNTFSRQATPPRIPPLLRRRPDRGHTLMGVWRKQYQV